MPARKRRNEVTGTARPGRVGIKLEEGRIGGAGYRQTDAKKVREVVPSGPAVSQNRLDAILDRLAAGAPVDDLTLAYDPTVCGCGMPKRPEYDDCKRCRIGRGAIGINIKPGNDSCPDCGDGKNPEFALCGHCSITRGYCDALLRQVPDGPQTPCVDCGALKPGKFLRCSDCWYARPTQRAYV